MYHTPPEISTRGTFRAYGTWYAPVVPAASPIAILSAAYQLAVHYYYYYYYYYYYWYYAQSH